MTASASGRLDALTSLRFFAAMAIVVHHCNGVFWDAADLGPVDAGVSFFFVLSGFILTYVYRDSLRGKLEILHFYVLRLARIWPLHLLCLLLTLTFLPESGSSGSAVLIANLLLLHAWIPFDQYFFSFNYVSWSISTELFFYLVFPALVLNLKGWANKGLCLSLFVAVVLVLTSYWAGLPTWDPSDNALSSTGVLYVDPLARGFEFMLGIATCALFLKSGTTQAVVSKWTWKATLIEAACIGIFLLGFEYFLPFCEAVLHWIALVTGATDIPLSVAIHDPQTLAKISPFGNFFMVEWGDHVGLAPFAALLVFVMARQGGAISRALSSAWLVFLGEISFALYLVHQIVIRYFQQHFLTAGTQSRTVLLGLYILFSIAISCLMHVLFEKPARKLIAKATRGG